MHIHFSPSCVNGLKKQKQKNRACNYPSEKICRAYTVRRDDIQEAVCEYPFHNAQEDKSSL